MMGTPGRGKWLVLVLVLMLWISGNAGAGVIRVKAGAGGTGNGTSWAKAFADLPTALAAAKSGDELWVAAGTYKPTTGTDRTKSFAMVANVALYGGFAGTETVRTARNWNTRLTILSGDIGTSGVLTDDSYHVILGASRATLDGFTVTGGYSNSNGGGMFNNNVTSLTVIHCTFSNNTATITTTASNTQDLGLGGGMYSIGGSLTVTDCTFANNTASRTNGSGTGPGGGGMYNANLTLKMSNCTFSGNATTYSGNMAKSQGGGMYNNGGSPAFTDCTFSYNTANSSGGANSYGGAMVNVNSSPVLTRCIISYNTINGSDTCGGGIYNDGGSPVVTQCKFIGNVASYGNGGGMGDFGSSPTISDCLFSGNMASIYGGGMCCGRYGDRVSMPTITRCLFTGNTAVVGGGMRNNMSTAKMSDCVFTANTGNSGGGLDNFDGIMTMTDCTFSGNIGGGVFNEDFTLSATRCRISDNIGFGNNIGPGVYCHGVLTQLTNCVLVNNQANGNGGGVFLDSGSLTATNSVIIGNTASISGGGVYNTGGGTKTFINCTIAGNTALGGFGGGIFDGDYANPLTFVNTIIWNNKAPQGADIYVTFNQDQKSVYRNCDIGGCGGSGTKWDTTLGTDGGGNIMTDPLWVDAAHPAGADGIWRTADDGLRLKLKSPCINAGLAQGAPSTDILYLPRAGRPDLGAYEYPTNGVAGWQGYP